MSERARARVVVGSMSALSAGMVVALVLGVSITIGHFLQPLTTRAGADAIRLVTPSSGGGAAPAVAPAVRPGPGAAAPPTGRAAIRPRAHTRDHPRHTLANTCCAGRHQPASDGSSVTVSAGKDVGGVKTGATATAGTSGASAEVDVGPVHESVSVDPKPVTATVKKTVCQLTC